MYCIYQNLVQVYPSQQICRKSNVGECIFDYMASLIECRFNKKLPPPVLLLRPFAGWDFSSIIRNEMELFQRIVV